MAFTANGTPTTTFVGRNQFQRLFSDVFAITITGVNPSSISAGAEDTATYTIPGLQKGDMVFAWSFSAAIGNNLDVQFVINTADELLLRISNLDPSAPNDVVIGTVKVLIGRPAF
jgi:hypothetical protein